jgi:hypothetical protein
MTSKEELPTGKDPGKLDGKLIASANPYVVQFWDDCGA